MSLELDSTNQPSVWRFDGVAIRQDDILIMCTVQHRFSWTGAAGDPVELRTRAGITSYTPEDFAALPIYERIPQ